MRDKTRYDANEVSARIGKFEPGDVDEEVALILATLSNCSKKRF